MRFFTASILALLLVGASARPSAAQVSFDGKSSSYHTISQTPLVSGAILAGSIALGKAKNVLVIDGMLTGQKSPFISWVLTGALLVNGISAGTTQVVQTCSGDASGAYNGVAVGCTVNGHWIVDIDATETANPGCCVNQPITVQFFSGYGGNTNDLLQPVDASLSVKMEKKK